MALAELLVHPAVLAQGALASAASQAHVLEAGHWLARIQSAAANRNYQGTLVFTAAGVVSSSRVTHVCEGRQRYERIEALDGRARTQIRHNDQLLTLWPGSRHAVVEQRESIVDFPGLPATAGQRAADSYDLRAIGAERVAGHDADVLMVKPRDGLRFAQRWWAERESGLLLRTDVLGSKGEVLESSAFSDLSLGGKAVSENLAAAMKKLEGWRISRPTSQRAQLEQEGWSMPRPVPGFQLVSCTKRPLDAGTGDSADVQVLQAVFSDGLTHVSVFIEAFDPQRHKQAMRTSLGAAHTVMSRHGHWWLTVVGDVPMATVLQFDAALERRH